MAPKGASRTPQLKEVLSEVLRIRSHFRRDSGKSGLENKSGGVLSRFRMKRWVYEENGSKGRFTNSAAERSALEVLRIRSHFRRDSGKSGLENKSGGVLSRFRMKRFDRDFMRL
ncbi:hypothetical protein MRB53_010211 [Persea americana]|uniref:Uncharacterized protein n=3 Tax=Persea americana TaxID=3435 RepID=A0ACC2LSC7_PERAE|nr:hypothetical protein MRB53_010206 [Persea americana]KAJ8635941.1 hypothetical protein MRB53_010208 [Persea americana]KAJ8635944.1 hypothetical protein MRB53_010211 [Persea americana]